MLHLPYARRRRAGFTIVELLVAGLVATMALAGVYAIITHVLGAERAASLRWQDRSAAAAVTAHIADALEYGLNPAGQSGVLAVADRDGGRSVTFFTQPRAAAGRDLGAGQLQLRRYRWGSGGGPKAAGGLKGSASDGGRSVSLQMQAMPYAGTANLVPIAAAQGADGGTPAWEQLDSLVIATGLSELSVQFQPVGDPAGKWLDDFDGAAGSAVVRVRARVGEEVSQRLVLPHVTGAVGETPEARPGR